MRTLRASFLQMGDKLKKVALPKFEFKKILIVTLPPKLAEHHDWLRYPNTLALTMINVMGIMYLWKFTMANLPQAIAVKRTQCNLLWDVPWLNCLV